MATQEDRSLSAGIALPQWMKNKMNDRMDFEKNVAFSPTELDDSFMYYYRNSRTGHNTDLINSKTSTVTAESNSTSSNLVGHHTSTMQASLIRSSSRPDYSKHTPPCQKYMENSDGASTAQKVQITSSITKTKSSGVDDGFKGEAAKCGTSVIRMAHQMVMGGTGFNFNQSKKDCGGSSGAGGGNADDPPEGFNAHLRRGSKSLPATPLGSPGSSPKSSRRLNRYFTGPFVDNENHQGNWLLSSLLAKRQNLSQSVTSIAEENESGGLNKSSTANSIDDVTDSRTNSKPQQQQRVFLPNPAEMREMNFWSPTSM